MNFYYSPLRYPGGKSTLLKHLIDIINLNNPIDIYIEPFAGGAGAALGLLFQGYVEKIILNDIDVFVFNIWNSIIHHTEEFISLIQTTPVNIETWYRLRKVIKDEKIRKVSSNIEIGFASFFMNRCNRSGIITGGPIGGYEQKGKWKIDVRFKKDHLIERIKRIADKKKFIEFYNFDAVEFLKKLIGNDHIKSNNSLIYLDPPYYEKGPLLYNSFYSQEEHENLNEFLKNECKIKWVLSYDDVDYINNLYQGANINGVKINHFAYRAKVAKELIISSDNCLLPFTSNK